MNELKLHTAMAMNKSLKQNVEPLTKKHKNIPKAAICITFPNCKLILHIGLKNNQFRIAVNYGEGTWKL